MENELSFENPNEQQVGGKRYQGGVFTWRFNASEEIFRIENEL